MDSISLTARCRPNKLLKPSFDSLLLDFSFSNTDSTRKGILYSCESSVLISGGLILRDWAVETWVPSGALPELLELLELPEAVEMGDSRSDMLDMLRK